MAAYIAPSPVAVRLRAHIRSEPDGQRSLQATAGKVTCRPAAQAEHCTPVETIRGPCRAGSCERLWLLERTHVNVKRLEPIATGKPCVQLHRL